MGGQSRNVDVVRAEILGAVDELRRAAVADGDDARLSVARQLSDRFAGLVTAQEVRVASRDALALWRGGMGSFQDVGNADTEHAVERLRRALRRGRWSRPTRPRR
ncbi:hypothetical protein IFT77_13005 [Frigoribacterium sp. CFBP 13729]|jgi:hypothetical protein|uniref:hypothetical protein n=1 Tax=unclassified Frigoribacterium TaxID=2627005 RepID=UPI00177F980E|nr:MULTISPECIES: hypothetical protein [unclassified Frigoribacterium]MBD8585818.1 hypothetical protein [Frigoribacterium sp. CFBP 8766]MBD8611404.1 hypothetical protein [Frigoribacterium sp. CFBP 13729]